MIYSHLTFSGVRINSLIRITSTEFSLNKVDRTMQNYLILAVSGKDEIKGGETSQEHAKTKEKTAQDN